jgi:hypothetical protein
LASIPKNGFEEVKDINKNEIVINLMVLSRQILEGKAENM